MTNCPTQDKMQQLLVIIVTFAFFATSYGDVVKYQSCASGPEPVQVRLEGCDKLPCVVKRGSKYILGN